MTQKTDLRAYYRTIRQQIPDERRNLAAQALFHSLTTHKAAKIVSFVSFGSEIDLTLINQQYASQGRLVLPKIELNQVVLYQVEDLERDLLPSSIGPLEPNATTCAKVHLDSLDLILVPGIVFDASGYRIGYGKGHYDRLLAKIPHVDTIGVAFVEQRSPALLPRDPWDIPVSKVLFV